MAAPTLKTVLNNNTLSIDAGQREQLILAERVHILLHQPLLKILVLGQGIAVGITVFFLWGTVSSRLLLVWLAYMIVNTIFWAGITIVYRRTTPPPEKAKIWASVFPAAGVLMGAAWGATALWPQVLVDPSSTVFLSIMVLGITAGGLAVLAPLLSAFYAFACLSLLPFTVLLVIQGGKLHTTLGVMFLLYLFTILISAHNMRRAVLESVMLRFENLSLVNDLIEKNSLAEQAGLEKTRFIASASHDLRQPLHALGLFVESLESRIRYPEVRSIVDNVKLATVSLSKLMNAMLDISKLDAGVLQPVLANVPLQALFDRIAVETKQDVIKKGLRLCIRPCQAVVRTDPDMLERILRNLISNAIHYTEQGSVFVGCRHRADKLCIEVRDSGIGIAEDELNKIFKDFYQLANPERDRSKGHGLGLAIVDRLTKLLGHSFSVKSAPGQGSTFRICLPLATNQTSATEASTMSPAYLDDVAGAIILVIDDDLMVRDGMAQILKEWGCEVLLAESAETAYAQLLSSGLQPDVIMTDYRLRENKTGVEAVAFLQEKTGNVIPTIIVTGDTAADRLREAKASGYQLLHKPVAPDKLRSLLSYLLTKSK